MQPTYGENYAGEQDAPTPHPPMYQQQQHPPHPQHQHQIPISNQDAEYSNPPPGFYPVPYNDAMNPPFSPTVPRQGPPQPPPPLPARVPEPNYPSPDLIAQVTAAVIQQLRIAQPGNNNPLASSHSHPPAPPAPPAHPAHPSLQQFNNYQPPTPALSNTSYKQSPNPDHTTSSPYLHSLSSAFSKPDHLSNAPLQSAYPPPIASKLDENVHSSPGTQHTPSRPGSTHPLSPTSAAMDRGQGSLFGSFNGIQDDGQRPKGPSRIATATDVATLEKIWGPLFNEDDFPTSRLGQLLRGMAIHIIENYTPKNGLVITPDKMRMFYSDNNVSTDNYPWQDIFDNRTSSISRLYRSMSIEHHLVQNRPDDRPDIPGLTARGFERWMTFMIQAHPDLEFERLQRVVQTMPIYNPDDKKERFPKELSRRLFPKVVNLEIKDTLDTWIMTHCHVELTPRMLEGSSVRNPRAKSNPDNTSADLPSRPTSTDVRPKHAPPAATVEDADDDDDDDHVVIASADIDEPLTQPIERERKPYSMLGGKKSHLDDPVSGSSQTQDAGISSSRKHHHPIYDDESDGRVSSNEDIRSRYGHSRSRSRVHSHRHGHSHDESKRYHGKDRDRDRDRDLDWSGKDRDHGRPSWGTDEDFYRPSTSDKDRGRRRGESRGHQSTYDNFWGYR